MRPLIQRFSTGSVIKTAAEFALSFANKTVVGKQRNFGSIAVRNPHKIKSVTQNFFDDLVQKETQHFLENSASYIQSSGPAEFPLPRDLSDFFCEELKLFSYKNDSALYDAIKKYQESVEKNDLDLFYLQTPRPFKRVGAMPASIDIATANNRLNNFTKFEYLKNSFSAICFSQTIMQMVGFKTYNNPHLFLATFFCDEHQGIHIDGASNLDDSFGATALIPVFIPDKSDGGITPTFFIDPREVAQNMTKEDLELLSKNEFYLAHPRSPDILSGPFKIYDEEKQKFRVSAGITHLNIHPLNNDPEQQEALRNFLRVVNQKAQAIKIVLEQNEMIFFVNDWLHQRNGENFNSPLHQSLDVGIGKKSEENPSKKTARTIAIKIFSKDNQKN